MTQEIDSGVALAPAEGEELTEAADALESFVDVAADGTFVITVHEDAAPVSSEAYDALITGMGDVNAQILAGELVSTEELDVYPAEVQAYGMESTGSRVYFRWWGVEVHLSSYATGKVTNAANISGASAALCAATGWCAPAAAVFAAAVWLAVSVIGFCSNSRGVIIKRSYGPVWCQGH